MNQRTVTDLSQAIFRAMPRKATYDQKAAIDLAARTIVTKYFDSWTAEANELDAVIDRKNAELAALHAEIAELRATIIETLRLGHEGRAALRRTCPFL